MDQDRLGAEPRSEGPHPRESSAAAPSERLKTTTTNSESPIEPPASPPLAQLLADRAPSATSKSSSTPLPSTETPDPSESATPMPAPTGGPRKKGTASSIPKRAPKRTKPGAGGDHKKTKRARSGPDAPAADEASDEDESDSGPYCICRGPDDHRWMICCERCEDWFHGECVHISKDVGEALIEKFVCPNCTTDRVMTIYKKTCVLHGCRRAARLTQSPASVFCTNEHAQTWWERVLARLPKIGARNALGEELSQEEFMALLDGGLAGVDGDGAWSFRAPFSADKRQTNGVNGDVNGTNDRLDYLTEEEVSYLDGMAKSRLRLAEETVLYHQMLALIEMVQDRRRAAISAGRFAEDICGYDQRLDSVCATDAFAAFLKTPEGETIFQASKVDDPLGEGDEVRGMCERKRCKAHSGWQKILVLDIRHQIREMEDQADEVAKEEKTVREAAGERSRRRRAEKNWVEVMNC
ncbi:Set1 complex component spp1 [Escovopsis weberi]|uniref:Set1 complex component spp1 n=1 Tax=Escovopsis weberi TaxID=150374 RepID=A0A0M8MXC3_ESCWE|nr:Set1 complex component spp1 [Escovopsis weberi]